MRRILVLTFIITQIIMGCKKDDLSNDCKSRYYYYDSEKIILTEIPNQGCISFYDTLSIETINQILEQYQGIQVLSIPSNSNHAIISVGSENCNETDKLFATIKNDSKISNCSKFFSSEEGYTLGITDVFVCKLKSSNYLSQMTELINDNHLEIIESDTSNDHYIIRADKNSNVDALDMANKFFESGFFEYAEPEFFPSYGTYSKTGVNSKIRASRVSVLRCQEISI